MVSAACNVWLDYQRRNRRAAAIRGAGKLGHHAISTSASNNNGSSSTIAAAFLAATTSAPASFLQTPGATFSHLNDTSWHQPPQICDPIGSSMTHGTCVSDIVVSIACIALWLLGIVAATVLLVTRGHGGRVGRRTQQQQVTMRTTSSGAELAGMMNKARRLSSCSPPNGAAFNNGGPALGWRASSVSTQFKKGNTYRVFFFNTDDLT
jgi:hypothetical protein